MALIDTKFHDRTCVEYKKQVCEIVICIRGRFMLIKTQIFSTFQWRLEEIYKHPSNCKPLSTLTPIRDITAPLDDGFPKSGASVSFPRTPTTVTKDSTPDSSAASAKQRITTVAFGQSTAQQSTQGSVAPSTMESSLSTYRLSSVQRTAAGLSTEHPQSV